VMTRLWSGRRQARRPSDGVLEGGFFADIPLTFLGWTSRNWCTPSTKVNDGILIFS
jgi:hypothetical protein